MQVLTTKWKAKSNVLTRLTLASAKARRGLAREDEIQPFSEKLTYSLLLLHVFKNIGHNHKHKSTPLGLMCFKGFPNGCVLNQNIAQGFRKWDILHVLY